MKPHDAVAVAVSDLYLLLDEYLASRCGLRLDGVIAVLDIDPEVSYLKFQDTCVCWFHL